MPPYCPRFIVIPDMLKNAPMFKKMEVKGRVRTARALWGDGKKGVL